MDGSKSIVGNIENTVDAKNASDQESDVSRAEPNESPVTASPEVDPLAFAESKEIAYPGNLDKSEPLQDEDSAGAVIVTSLLIPNVKSSIEIQLSHNLIDSPENGEARRAHIETAAPIESVKAAVSKFGGIVDWKAHRVQTLERQKFVELEVEKAREEIPLCKKQVEEAEEAKLQVLQQLDNTKLLIEELKVNCERAEKEEQQVKQDCMLAKLRVKEIEQGIADESSIAAKAQIEVAIARHAAAALELIAVKQELEQLRKDYAVLMSARDAAVQEAEEAVLRSREVEKSGENLTLELIASKESLESAQAAHLEAEEHRIGAVMAKEQDILILEKEMKQVEEELDKVTQQMLASKDLKSKLDTATALLQDLKSEMAAYMESRLRKDLEGDENVATNLENQGEIETAISTTKGELEEVKLNVEKAADEVNILKVAATSLMSELEKEKMELAAIQQREGMASITVASLEAELQLTRSEIARVQMKEKEAKLNMVELPKQLQLAAQEADQAKALAQVAREELEKAKEDAEQAKAKVSTMESRLQAAQKEIEAAKASEKLAVAAINALLESESAQKSDLEDLSTGITLSLEEYYALSKQAHEAEEQASMRVAAAMAQIEVAKESELRSLKILEEVNLEMDEKKSTLQDALEKAETAKEGKLGAEQELRKWRADHGQRRRVNESVQAASRSAKIASESSENVNSKHFISSTGSPVIINQPLSPSSFSSNTSDISGEIETTKKKKKSFFPKMFLFLGRKKTKATFKPS